MENFAEILEQLGPYEALLPIALIALVLAIILIAFFVGRIRKANRAKEVAPYLVFHQLQIAPLERDLRFRIRNIGEQAIIKSVSIKKKKNLKLTKFYKDYDLERAKTYDVFIEAIGTRRIDTDFDILITYQDQLYNTYSQLFNIKKADKGAKVAKLVEYA